MKRAAVAALILANLAGLAAAEEPTRTIEQSLPRGEHRHVLAKLRIGTLHVEGTDADQIEVKSLIHCVKKNRAKCEAAARAITLKMTTTVDELVIGMEGVSEGSLRKMVVENFVRMPRDLPVRVNVEFGDADIRGMEGNVEASVTSGDAKVRLDRKSVRAIRLAAAGKARLYLGADEVKGKGFPRNVVEWKSGEGWAEVKVETVDGSAEAWLE